MFPSSWCFAQTRKITGTCSDPHERTQRMSISTTWLAQIKQANYFDRGYISLRWKIFSYCFRGTRS